MDQNDQTFNLADVAEVLNRRKTFLLLFVLSAGLVAAILVFFILPKKYKSTAVVIAANPVLADKGSLFNENIEGLYSSFGGEDDLNRLYGIAQLDTTYKLIIDKFNLRRYYDVKEGPAVSQRKAIDALKDDIEILKTDLYQLRISVTTKDKNLSAGIANYITEIMQFMLQDFWKKSYQNNLEKLTASSTQLEQQYNALSDSSRNQLAETKKMAMLQQLQQNEKIANQFKIALNNNTPALMVLEKAYPSAKADKPKKLLIIAGAMLAALAFGIIAVLVFERRQ